MSASYLRKLFVNNGPALRSVSKLVGLVVPAAGTATVPHGLALSGPVGGVQGCRCLVAISQVDPVPVNAVSLLALDAVNVGVMNPDGVPHTVDVDLVLLYPWLGLDNAPPGINLIGDAAGLFVPQGGTAPAAFNCRDRAGGPIIAPEIVTCGHSGPIPVPSGVLVRLADPLLADPQLVTLDRGGPPPGDTVDVAGASLHTVERLPAGVSPADVLISVAGPIAVPPAGSVVVPHGLLERGVAVVPDAAWTIVVGGAGPNLPLGAGVVLIRSLVDAAAVTWSNNGAPVTIYALALYHWSGGRVP